MPEPDRSRPTRTAIPLLFPIGRVPFFSGLLGLVPCASAFPRSGVRSHRTLGALQSRSLRPPNPLCSPSRPARRTGRNRSGHPTHGLESPPFHVHRPNAILSHLPCGCHNCDRTYPYSPYPDLSTPIPSHQNHSRAPNAKPEPSGSIPSQLTSNVSPNLLTPSRLSNALLNTPTPLRLVDAFPT